MVSKTKVLEKTRPPKIDLLKKKEKALEEQKGLNKALYWILIILAIISIFEIIILLLR
jgi:hypothetical protein